MAYLHQKLIPTIIQLKNVWHLDNRPKYCKFQEILFLSKKSWLKSKAGFGVWRGSFNPIHMMSDLESNHHLHKSDLR